MMRSVIVVFVVAFGLTQVANLITTVYLHRALTHRALTLHPIAWWTCRVGTWLLTGIRPQQWVAVHRRHHAHTDTDLDPHSPARLGWLRVQLTNVALYRRAAADPETIRKYGRDLAPHAIETKLLNHAVIGLGITVVALIWVFGPKIGVASAVAHFVLYLALSGSVNGPGHHFGRRPYDNSATNLIWLALLTSGEGLHNHHHAAPTSARFARRWWQPDAGWWLIRIMKSVGLAELRPAQGTTPSSAA